MIALSWRDHHRRTKCFLLLRAPRFLTPIKSPSFPSWEPVRQSFLLDRFQTLSSRHPLHSPTLLNRDKCHYTTLGPKRTECSPVGNYRSRQSTWALRSPWSVKVGSRINTAYSHWNVLSRRAFRASAAELAGVPLRWEAWFVSPLGMELKSLGPVSSATKQS